MLDGFRVIEFEGLGPGPFAGMMLADLGADVIVIHRPGGPSPIMADPNILDRGKRSIVLDLKDGEDLEVAKALIRSADALIEGNRPGVMERLGLGPEDVRPDNPALVYGRMTGWGQDGPRAQQAGHDFNYIATSGALWFSSQPGDIPQPPPSLVGDIGGGALYLVAGILAGLLKAQKTGEGCVVDAAIVDGSAHMMALLLAIGGTSDKSLLDGPHWSRVYRCADGGCLSVQCIEPKFYRLFLERLELQDDPRLASQNDPAQWPGQIGVLSSLFAQKPLAHWAAVFDETDACAAPVLSPEDAAQDPHMRARGIWQSTPLQPAPAPRFGDQRPQAKPVNPRGADSRTIRHELGLKA